MREAAAEDLTGKCIAMKHAPYRVLLLMILMTTVSSAQLRAVALQLAIPAMHSGIERLQQWTPIVRHIEETTGLEIDLIMVKDHRALAQGMKDKFYDVGFVNALWESQMTAGSTGIDSRARVLVHGSDTFATVIIVNTDSVIRSLHELRGRYLALTVEGESLGGYYVPLCMLTQAGIDPYERFDQIIYSGTFDSILKGVVYGAVDAGAITTSTLLDAEMDAYREQIRILAVSSALPQWALIAQNGVKEVMIDRFIEAVIGMGTQEEGMDVLERAGFTRFSEIGNSPLVIDEGYLTCIEEAAYAPAK